ncbi:MAG: hypothetical protein J0G30_05850 [Actinomycetales bacterium]|nr:hypothetical protein [Actinomycetales bacterium]
MSQQHFEYHLDDFTESGYREIIRSARSNYRFESYGTESDEPHVLWRHDVDFSPHRAARLAEIEADEGVRATYFVLLHSEFYNWLEADVTGRFRQIADLGHDLGLHFDASFYAPYAEQAALAEALDFERSLLERIFGRDVRAFSFHNPDVGDALQFDADEIAGMVNAYGRGTKERYAYCSDSNGYWRFHRLSEFLESGHVFAQVLTHPEWWTPSAMMPRDRVQRAIDGRAAATAAGYDELLARIGRHNAR